ncbi:D-serine permease DsdX [Klebsiella pneumoniae]|uniref:D-serine permease DsdX n=1 Tax=Klebsiella pneumoniae TaxID=573 RepID=A0A4P0XGJ6_KLEPN|nr:D-serine permease DsdX [Klebsiella pneumoniae]
MESQIWVVSTLLISIVLIVLTIVKLKFHPFLALLLASFFVGAMMGMGPLEMVNAIESGIGGTLGFLAAVIGLGTILGKMMEVSGAAERIGLTLQRCRWLSVDVIMVLVGLICGITLFVEVGGGAADPAGILHRQKNQYFAAEAGYSAVYRADGGALRGTAASGRAVRGE